MKKGHTEELARIEERDPPPRSEYHGSWVRTLEPLLKAPNRWFMVRACDTAVQAQDAQSNLTGRKVNIPQPEHDWVFAARGAELFAIYHGKGRPVVPQPKSTARSSRTRTKRQEG
jgi:hypothetical protein